MGYLSMFKHFTLTTDPTTLVTCFNLKEMPPFSPAYNIAPGDRVVTVPASMERSPRHIGLLDWGLIFDDKDVARKEDRVATVRDDSLSSPRYESSFRYRRCLVLADGLFVWQLDNDVPKYSVRRDQQPFALAGIRQRFSKGEESWDTCAIITINMDGGGVPGQALPVCVSPEDYDKWTSPMVTKVAMLKKLMTSLPLGQMESRAVGDHVKDANDKLPHCIDPRA
jgi:putative SOS response-associated peptidase YedK